MKSRGPGFAPHPPATSLLKKRRATFIHVCRYVRGRSCQTSGWCRWSRCCSRGRRRIRVCIRWWCLDSGSAPARTWIAIRGRWYDHNFLPFSAKKWAFFSKTNVMIKVLHNLALFWVKNANFFAEFLGENIWKIITSVPGVHAKRASLWAHV
jgi:hypothetical protein